MKCKTLCLCGGAMIAMAALLSPLAFAGDPVKPAYDAAKDALKKGSDAAKDAMKKGTDAAKDAIGGGEDAAAMQRWMDYATPGEPHKLLASWVGEWDMKVTTWMVPGAPPVVNTSTATTKSSMDGRYFIEKVKGSFDFGDGQGAAPFEGMALMGYDNSKQKYFSIWIDNMGTGKMEEWGTADAAGKVFTYEGSMYDPMAGADRKSKSIATIVDADTRNLEMFMPGPDGKMFKHMEIVYTRKK